MQKNKISNICIIADDYPTNKRPVYIFVQQLVEAIVDLGIAINVVAPQSVTRSLFRGVPIMPKQETYRTSNGNTYKVFRPYSITLGNGKKILYKLINRYNRKNIDLCLNKINPQIVYGHFWGNAVKAFNYCTKHNKPLFVACGEGDNALEEWVDNLTNMEKDIIRKKISGVISVSTENKCKCINYNLCTEKNIIVLPNCVNTDLFKPQDASQEKNRLGIKADDFTIIFIGGFITRKGPDRLAQAVTYLNDEHIKVMFIGKKSNGYNYYFDCPGTIYKGPLSHDKLPIMLNCADIFVLPTQKEGCSNAIVEALACGLPVISSNGAFNDDILSEKNSIRIDPNDVDELAKAIAYLRDNPNELKKMREFSLCRHDSYSIESRALNIINFIEMHI